jgi:hypothetical protein
MSHPVLNNPEEYRGYFIAEFAKLERVIDSYLATYFTDDPKKVYYMISILIDRIPFESKRTALKVMIDNKDDEDFKAGKHGNKKVNHKKLLEDIRKLAHIRNYFAHYLALTFGEKYQQAISLAQFRDGLNIIHYSHEAFFEEIDKITLSRDAIVALLGESGLGLWY